MHFFSLLLRVLSVREMGQQSLIYSFVARGTVVLAEFIGNFTSIASQCLQKLPSSNNKFTYNCDGHTFNYLVEDGFSMHAGLPKFVPVNLKDIEASGFQEGEEVSLASLKKKGLINPSGRERRLPLKVSLKRFLAWRPTILQCDGRTGGDS